MRPSRHGTRDVGLCGRCSCVYYPRSKGYEDDRAWRRAWEEVALERLWRTPDFLVGGGVGGLI